MGSSGRGGSSGSWDAEESRPVKGSDEGKKVRSKKKKKSLWLLWVFLFVGFGVLIYFLFFRKKVRDTSKDFYAGALNMDPKDVKEMSKEYLSGKLSAQRREEKWGNPGQILGLKPKSVQAFYGNSYSGGNYGDK